MEKYSGWKQIGGISIIYSTNDYMTHNGKKYPKAYVAETKNKKAIESGVRWAESYEWSKDYKTKSYRKPEVVETDNKDFSFQIISAAGNSWQGGKLSFWMCLMEKKGIKPFAVGINADILCDLILETVMNKGKTDEKVFFARKNGQLGVMHENMPSYQELLKDEQLKKDVAKKKTTKWKIGYKYQTLTTNDIMFGMFSKIVSFNHSYNSYYGCDSQLAISLDFTRPDYVLYGGLYKSKNPKISDVYKDIVEDISYDYLKPKCPSRQEGEQIFEETPTYYKDLVDYMIAEKNDATDRYYSIEHFIHTAFAIFRHDKEATIKILEKTKVSYNKCVEELYASDKFPKWVQSADWYEQDITDSLKRNRAWGTIRSEAELRKEKKDKILREKFYDRSAKPIKLSYNGTTEEFTDWSNIIDRMIEIAKKEK